MGRSDRGPGDPNDRRVPRDTEITAPAQDAPTVFDHPDDDSGELDLTLPEVAALAREEDFVDAVDTLVAVHPPPAPRHHAVETTDDEFAPEEIAMLRDFFRDEAHDVLERLTARLLAAGTAQPAADDISEMMRATHTLKGSAGTVGLHDIAECCHELEDQLARLRHGQLPWNALVLDQLVEVIDALRSYVDGVDTETSHRLLAERVRQHLAALGAFVADVADPTDVTIARAAPPRAVTEDDERTAVQLGPRPDPDEPLDASAGTEDVSDGTPLEPFQREDESTRAIIAGAAFGRGSGDSGAAPVLDAVAREEFRRDGRTVLRVDPSRIDALMDSVGELVFDRTRIERRVQFLHKLARDLARTRHALRDEIRRVGDATTSDRRRSIAMSLRTIEEELAEGVTQLTRASAALLEDGEALRRTSASLQRELTRVRMLSAGALFQRLARALRSIVRRAGKRVRLVTTGDDTEFDKTVAEQITDPLIQLLRNAVAHGIEPMDERVADGKPPEGTIRIDARQEGGLVMLEVSDDGAGIDPDALRRRFVERGRWSEARARLASDEDALRALFDPGVSTRDEADQLAGRGVGLDAVRDTIARLGGEIRLASTVGRGTAFTMRLPVSTSVSQALLFKVHGEVFAVPNVHVVETVQIELDGPPPSYVQIRDDRLPLVLLQRVMNEASVYAGAEVMPAVVIEYAGKRLAFTCDKLVGPREIFVKSLGPLLSPLPLYAGATISGSGKVQLILDPAALVQLAYPGSQPIQATEFSPESTGIFPIAEVSGRVLVVDDSRAIREAIASILAGAGYVVDQAEHGGHAWSMLGELTYRAVVTDLEMPQVDGFTLIARLRANPKTARLPVIVVSSRATEDSRHRAAQLGVHRFVQKPVTPRKLLDAMSGVAR